MGVFEAFGRAVTVLFGEQLSLRPWVMFLLTAVSVASIRVLFMFRARSGWIPLGCRIVGGVVPLVACLLLFVALEIAGESYVALDLEVNVAVVFFGLVAGGAGAFLLGRFVEPRVLEFMDRNTQRAGLPDQLTDIRNIEHRSMGIPASDLDAIFLTAVNDDLMFFGVDVAGEHVTIDRNLWKSSHVQIMGPPGTGKGIQAAVALSQSLLHGDAVFIFDPKEDEWAPSVYRVACERASVPFQFIDLRKHQLQVNPILNAEPHEVEELFYAGFELGRRGEAADFYRLDDRKAARHVASFVEQDSMTLSELSSEALSSSNSELFKGAKAFFSALDEVSELPCIQTKHGVDFAERLERGGCVYIVGSMRNEPIVVLQKMLFVRIIQLCEKMQGRERHSSIFLDEFKYLLSLTALNALGAIRDKGCNILLAHQSLGDFGHCGSDLSESSVRTTVLDTTPIKWLYRPADFETASWISNQTGKILATTQSMTANRNPELVESLSENRSLGETTRNLIDTNTVQTLPKSCAVFIGVGLPRLAFATAVQVAKTTPELSVAELSQNQRLDLLARNAESVGRSNFVVDEPNLDFEDCPEDLLLKFLYSEIWTHIDICADLLEQVDGKVIRQVLEGLVDRRLIRMLELSLFGSNVDQFLGITKHGIVYVQERFQVTAEQKRSFTKGMINVSSVNHQLDIQRLRLRAEQCGWQNWSKRLNGEMFTKGSRYPDAVATRSDGAVVAIEVERTVKTKSRYNDIIVSHLHFRKLGFWDEIYYFCPNSQLRDRLEKIYSEITEVSYMGKQVPIDNRHLEPFRFLTYEERWW